MPGKPVKVGPFIGGLNNVSTAGESSDDEVVELVNFDLALDTSLVSRPPFEITMPISTANNWKIHGVYRITADDWYVIASQPSTNADQWFLGAWALGDMTSGRISIKTLTGTNNVITGYVQYNDWCYFSVGNGSSIAGFRWKKDTAAADIATMPKGSVLVSWRDRLWVTGSQTGATGNYVWFSTVDAGGPKPNTWNVSVDFFNVDPGSGGLNTAMLPLTNSLLIFKEDATYRFSFPNAPKQGEISSISRQIGAAGPNSVAAFENYAFIYDQGRVYELMNTKFSQLNINVDFGKTAADSVDSTAPGVDMSIVSRRLIIRYYTNIFAYAIDTKTWSQWYSYIGTPGMFIELPGDSNSAQPSVFLAGLAGVTQLAGANRINDPGFQDEVENAYKVTQVSQAGIASIENGALTITSTKDANTYVPLSQQGGFDIPVSSQQILELTVNVDSFTQANFGDGILSYVTYEKLDGTTSSYWFLLPFKVQTTNLATNPEPKTSLTGWGTLSMDNVILVGPYSQNDNRKGIRGTINSATGTQGFNVATTMMPFAAPIGRSVTISMYIFVNKACTINFGGYFKDAAGVQIPNSNSSYYVDIEAGVWTRLSKTIVNGAVTATSVYLYAYVSGTKLAVGDLMYASRIMGTYGDTLYDYFDGDSVGVSTDQTYNWTGTASASRSEYKVRDVKTGLNTFQNLTVPAGAYIAKLFIGVNRAGMKVTVSNPSLRLKTGRSPAGIVKFIDGYQDVASREFIKCFVKTKAYDYQANSVFKRLFLWGVDVVTPREMVLKAIPLGKTQQVTWKDMQAYTWGQLNAGIWRNPLSWRGTSTTITDITGPFVEVSENGRFFVQSPKSLRFRQIQYSVELSTLGNRETGPAKLFSITTYTDTKAKVVDKAT